jgi:hypothetical protein
MHINVLEQCHLFNGKLVKYPYTFNSNNATVLGTITLNQVILTVTKKYCLIRSKKYWPQE